MALSDLRLVAAHLAPNGIIAVDDYQHPDWPQVTAAVDTFIAESGFNIVADANRWAEAGRKLYLSCGNDKNMQVNAMAHASA